MVCVVHSIYVYTQKGKLEVCFQYVQTLKNLLWCGQVILLAFFSIYSQCFELGQDEEGFHPSSFCGI